ncbi:21479_t:CDS:2 [Dentiscutata erythropus]|uniref:21479_t:CDS:1 n=1 Tax=Dentiscutata erythropus TaxID=1348616 RepID=A0A9N9F1N8_9GLOM|nr:21479_t:CDS:2 [Dentiscutata erythropus]
MILKYLNLENEIRKKSRFIDWDELRNVSKLDEGYFGFIFKAYWTNARRDVVCKALINLKDINSKYCAAFIHELTMQTRADLCENIVRFLGVSKEEITNSKNLPEIDPSTINLEDDNNSKTLVEQTKSTVFNVDYDENDEIDLTSSTDLDEERFDNITDKINEELFETAIGKKSKFIDWDELINVSKLDEGYFEEILNSKKVPDPNFEDDNNSTSTEQTPSIETYAVDSKPLSLSVDERNDD